MLCELPGHTRFVCLFTLQLSGVPNTEKSGDLIGQVLPLWQSLLCEWKLSHHAQYSANMCPKFSMQQTDIWQSQKALDHNFSNSINSLWCVDWSYPPAFTVITNTASILEILCPVHNSVHYVILPCLPTATLMPEPPRNLHFHYRVLFSSSHNSMKALPLQSILHPNPTDKRHILNRA
jgi:hypothetical protein